MRYRILGLAKMPVWLWAGRRDQEKSTSGSLGLQGKGCEDAGAHPQWTAAAAAQRRPYGARGKAGAAAAQLSKSAHLGISVVVASRMLTRDPRTDPFFGSVAKSKGRCVLPDPSMVMP